MFVWDTWLYARVSGERERERAMAQPPFGVIVLTEGLRADPNGMRVNTGTSPRETVMYQYCQFDRIKTCQEDKPLGMSPGDFLHYVN